MKYLPLIMMHHMRVILNLLKYEIKMEALE
jgi:hypothetical protein